MASKTSTSKTTTPVETKVEEVETPKEKKSKWTPLSEEVALQIAAVARPAKASCLCGCGNETKGRFFPGHDATLKETLKVTVEKGEGNAKVAASEALAKFGWA